MAATPIKDQKNIRTDRTWAEEFRGIDTTSKAYKDLLKQLTDTVAAQNAFVQDSRKDFEEYVKGLDNISDSWTDVQREIEKLTIQTEVYGTTAEDVQRIFTDIANSASTVAQRLTVQKAVMRNIADVAGEISRTYVVDSQFTEKSLNAHIQKLQIAKSQFEFQIKAITGGSLEEEDRKKAAEDSERRVKSLQNRIDKQLYLNDKQKRGLEEEIRLENIKLESLNKYNEAVLEGLQKEAQFDLKNRRNINSKFSGLQEESGILGKVAGAFGLGDLKSEIEGIGESARQRIGILYKNKHLAEVDLDKKKGLENQSEESFINYGKSLGISDKDLEDIVKKIQENPGMSSDSLAGIVGVTAQSYGIDNDAILDKLVHDSETHRQNVLGTADSSKQLETAQKNTANATGIARDAAAQMAKHFAKSVFSARALSLWVGSSLWKSFTAVDESAVKLQRAVGTWEGSVAGANTGLATSKDYLEQAYAIAKKFGVNTSAVFTPAELARAAEFKNLSNLSADQVATLAVRAKVVGKNINEYNESLNNGWKSIVGSTSAAVNFEAVQEEVANISAALAISLGGNPEKIAEAATAARSLGMSLKDMESVADNLLNFESSIKSEMEAQLLTGMSLNLAGARECALYNDIVGLAEQLNGQGLTFEKLAGMNRVQLNSVAQTLGMSKDQLAEMVQQQVLSSNMSDKQKAAMLKMTDEDFRRMTTEKQWQQTKEKFLQSLVPLMKPVVDILTMMLELTRPIVGLIGQAVSLLEEPINLIQKTFSSIQKFFGEFFQSFGKGKKGAQEVVDQVQDLSASVQKAGPSFLTVLAAINIEIVVVVKVVQFLGSTLKATWSVAKFFGSTLKTAFLAPVKRAGKLVGWIKKISGALKAASVSSQKFSTSVSDAAGKVDSTEKLSRGRNIFGRMFSSAKNTVSDAYTGARDAVLKPEAIQRDAKAYRESRKNILQKTRDAYTKKSLASSVSDQAKNTTKASSSVTKGVKGFASSKVLQGAAAMLLVSLSLVALAGALRMMQGVDDSGKKIMTLMGGLLGMAVTLVLIGKIGQDAIFGALALAIVGVSLIPLAFALSLLKDVDWKQFGILAASVLTFTLELAALGAAMSVLAVPLGAGAVAVVLISGALAAMGKALQQVAALQPSDVGRVEETVKKVKSLSKNLGEVETVKPGKFRKLKRVLNILSGFKNIGIASELNQVTDALSRFSEILNRLDVEKFNKLSVRRIKAIAKVQTQQQPEGVQENYKATVQTRAITDSKKQSRVESVEKSKVDLSVIEQKLDIVVKAIENSRPNWNWLEFDKAAATGLPGWQRNR